MRYYSDVTKSMYNTEKELVAAEQQVKVEEAKKARAAEEEKARKDKMAAERKARAAEVEEARKAMTIAQKNYQQKLEQFVQTYGTYHLSLNGEDAEAATHSLFDIFNPFYFSF